MLGDWHWEQCFAGKTNVSPRGHHTDYGTLAIWGMHIAPVALPFASLRPPSFSSLPLGTSTTSTNLNTKMPSLPYLPKRLVVHLALLLATALTNINVQLGPRPLYLLDALTPSSPIRPQLEACLARHGLSPTTTTSAQPLETFHRSNWVIGHRGASLYFPEHTRESYVSAARSGAGVVECDVTFTKDHALVCRHSQCDLHATTNILLIPDLATKCRKPFQPATDERAVDVECCASDLTLAEYKRLCGRIPNFDRNARSPEEYLLNPKVPEKPWDVNGAFPTCAAVMTHKESIKLLQELQVRFTPELKEPKVDMPHQGYSYEDYRRAIIQEYIDAGVDPSLVFLQSFVQEDIEFWAKEYPEFAENASYLDERMDPGQDGADKFKPTTAMFEALQAKGIHAVAPPMEALLTVDKTSGALSPSEYARTASKTGMAIVTWTLASSMRKQPDPKDATPFTDMAAVVADPSRVYDVLHALDTQVGVDRIFTNWPATAAFYDNCLNPDRVRNSSWSPLKSNAVVAARPWPSLPIIFLGFVPLLLVALLVVQGVRAIRVEAKYGAVSGPVPGSPASSQSPLTPAIEGMMAMRMVRKLTATAAVDVE